MGCVKNAEDGLKRVKRFRGREPTALLNLSIESMTFDVFHHHIDGAVSGSAKVINSYCIGMTKTSGSLAFASKTSKPLCIGAHFRRKDFYGYAITQQNMARAIHCSHSTLSQQGFYLVLAVEHGVHDR